MLKSNEWKRLCWKLCALIMLVGGLVMMSGGQTRAVSCDSQFEECSNDCYSAGNYQACQQDCQIAHNQCVADGGNQSGPPSPYQDGPSGGPRHTTCIPCNIYNSCMAGRIYQAERDACIANGGTAESCCTALAGL